MASEAQDRALRVGATPTAHRVHRATRALIRIFLHRYFRLVVVGAERLDLPGPVILAPTHRSNLDSLLVSTVGDRRARALSKESLFSNRFFAWYITCLGAFPVVRGTADRDAMRAARSLLDDGEQLLVFPEGTRQVGGEIGELFDGTAYLAAKSHAVVVPVGVAGTEEAMPPGARFPRRRKVAIVVGEPIAPPGEGGRRARRSELAAHTEALGEALQESLNEAQRRVG